MKTLNEQVDEIKNMKGSKAAKKAAFVKLGLRKYEVELLMSELPKTIRETHKFTFGVEIECLVAACLMRESATRNAMPFQYEGYNHTDNKNYYKFVSDSSIRGENPIECVSPVLTGKAGMKSLETCCKALNEAGAQVNRSTGLHVHIGAQKMSDETYINVFKNYQKLERVIDTFMANSAIFCPNFKEYSKKDYTIQSAVEENIYDSIKWCLP